MNVDTSGSAADAILRDMIEGVPLPTVLISSDERILAANPPALALFGEGTIGRHYVLFMRQPALLDAVEGTRTHRHITRARYIVSGAAGETVFRVTVAPVHGNDVMCSFEDISEMEKAGLMRRDFVANVSHELRTPLTSLLGFIETLQGAAKDDPVARGRFLGIMAREAERMNRLVSDLLSLSRVESEERVRPTTPSDIVALVASAVTALRPTAATAGAEIVVTGEEGPLVAPADPDQMTQVFQNLIENAIKYGASGGTITVNVARDDTDTQRLGPTVLISVSDKGDGIDPIHIPRLTERFYRVDNHRSREMGGTGLGLAIVKHIVNRHRGRFRIKSAKGEGSTFTIILPQA